jgi:hypothetical protein
LRRREVDIGPNCPIPREFSGDQIAAQQDATIGVKRGAAPTDARTFEAVYTKPYMSHGSIGPSCAVAEFKDGRMTVWTLTGRLPIALSSSKC